MKIFLDANIFVAAAGSATGGSRYLFKVAATDPTWHFITSPLAVREARLNVQKKLPTVMSIVEDLILSPSVTITQNPPPAFIEVLQTIIAEKDAPILAAAIAAQANIICTLDKKDFHTAKVDTWCSQHGIVIVQPVDLLHHWRGFSGR